MHSKRYVVITHCNGLMMAVTRRMGKSRIFEICKIEINVTLTVLEKMYKNRLLFSEAMIVVSISKMARLRVETLTTGLSVLPDSTFTCILRHD